MSLCAGDPVPLVASRIGPRRPLVRGALTQDVGYGRIAVGGTSTVRQPSLDLHLPVRGRRAVAGAAPPVTDQIAAHIVCHGRRGAVVQAGIVRAPTAGGERGAGERTDGSGKCEDCKSVSGISDGCQERLW